MLPEFFQRFVAVVNLPSSDHRFSVGERVVPDETGGRIRQRVLAALAKAAAGIAARRAVALRVFGRDAAVGPVVAVRAQNAAAVGVVQQRR